MAAPITNQSQNIAQFNRFLQNNNDMLQQKYHEHFAEQKIKITAKQPRVETVVNFIADVFSFDNVDAEDKHGKNKQIIRDSLKNSYEGFLKRYANVKEFNVNTAVQLLRFCIQSNQMFAVHYENNKDVYDNKNKLQPNQPQLLRTNPQQQSTPTSLNNPKYPLQDPNSPHSNPQNLANLHLNFSNISNEFSPMRNGSQSQTPVTKPRQRNTFDDIEQQNQFNFHEEIKLDLDPMLVKKNIKMVFQYYCKQQMALSPNLSFDRIQRESHMMTLSKMLLMARMLNILNGSITKELLIRKFRKISQGKREIDFKKFDILMSQLQIQDPSLIARAELNSQNMHLYLKTTKKPFDTQDMLPRQLIKNRNFTNKLTLHSGKMQTDLIEDLKTKRKSCILEDGDRSKQKDVMQRNSMKNSRINSKMKQYYEEVSQKVKERYEKQKQKEKEKDISKIKQGGEYSSMLRKQSEIITTKNLAKPQRNYSHDLSMLKVRKIIAIDHDDDKWLGEYKINSSIKKAQAYDDSLEKKRSFEDKQRNSVLIQDLRKRVKQIQQTENSSNGLDQTKPYLISSVTRRG